jgi:uncharacterized protein GlcG (DUF336 family)
MDYLNVAQALRMVEAGKAASEAANVSASIAVVDGGGHLLAFLRLDGALLATIDASQVKARTAVFFGTESKNLPFDKPFTPALLGAVSYPLAFVPGGVPLIRNGRILGAVGVGGGSGQQDHAIAQAATEAFV